MNLSFYSVALWASTLFSNASFDTVSPEKEIITESKTSTAYATGWESVPSWSLKKADGKVASTYSRNTPELNDAVLNGGAIAVFAKGYDFEGFSKSVEKPLGLPFYMMAASEDFENPFAWFSENSVGSIKVGLQMPAKMESTFEKSSSKIRFRYFVLSKEFLKAHNLSQQSVRSLSYSQLTQMLGVAP